MSNYHILDGGVDGNTYTVAMHIPIPNANNLVGVNYRTALTEYLPSTASQVPSIQAAEQTQLDNGELVEIVVTFNTDPAKSLAQNRDAIDALYNAMVTKIQTEHQNRLKFWGFSRDVP